MQNISYYIVTRFNVNVFNGKLSRDKNVSPERDRLSEKYLKGRFDFFEKHTLCAMQKQKNKNFKWILMFHAETPQIFKDRVEKYKKEFENIVVLYVPDDVNANDMLSKYLEENAENEWISVSRIDNDDEYMEAYMDELQKMEFDLSNEGYVVSFVNGIKYDVRKNILWRMYKENNNCIALVTKKHNEINHPLKLDHTKVTDKDAIYPLVCIKNSSPKWLVNIHGTNLGNTYRYHIKDLITSKKELEKYPFVKMNGLLDYMYYIIKGLFYGMLHEIWFALVDVKCKIRKA